VTAFAPITDTAGYHDDLQFAQLVKAQVTACFAIFEEYPLGMPGGPPTRTGPRDLEALADGTTRATEGIAPGMRVRGAPGAKLSGFSPNVPIIEVLRLGQDEAVTSTGTTAESFTVDSDSSGAKLKLDTNSATGDFTLSVSPANLTAIRPSHPAPAGTAATLGSAARCRPSARPAGGTRGNGPRPGLYERR
jgi:hypothetical protein